MADRPRGPDEVTSAVKTRYSGNKSARTSVQPTLNSTLTAVAAGGVAECQPLEHVVRRNVFVCRPESTQTPVQADLAYVIVFLGHAKGQEGRDMTVHGR
jgi:hypothetical protein